MWLFTRYGFFSIVCVQQASGWYQEGRPLEFVDSERLFIRARRKEHLLALQRRFPQLSSLAIEETPHRDYCFRITVLKAAWLPVIHELASEQTWPNFKSEVHEFQGPGGTDYTKALHAIWAIMKKLQDSAPRGSEADDAIDGEEAYWDGITQPFEGDTVRQELADAARDYQWQKVLEIVEEHRDLINATRPGGQSLYAPLHQVAHAGADKKIAESLIAIGAWRALRNAERERPLDIANRKGHVHLLDVPTPVYRRHVSEPALLLIQRRFHDLIREIAGTFVQEHNLRLPELEPLLEYETKYFWFRVPGMYGGFKYRLAKDDPEPRIGVQSWNWVIGGSGLHHDVSEHSTTLLDRGFV